MLLMKRLQAFIEPATRTLFEDLLKRNGDLAKFVPNGMYYFCSWVGTENIRKGEQKARNCDL